MNVCQSPVHESVMCVCVCVSLHACGQRLAPIISLVGYDPPTVGVAELKHVVNVWLQSFLLLDMTRPLKVWLN